MGTINYGRVILAGLAAGLVVNIIANVAYGFILADAVEEALAPVGASPPGGGQIALLWVGGFAFGIVLAWVYAAMRPRFGPGVGTATKAALAVWVVSSVLPAFDEVVIGTAATNFVLSTSLVGLIGALAGAWTAGYFYREEEAAEPAAAPPPPPQPSPSGPMS
ncbi:MAG: hypothetical protein ACE5HV_09915 [Acidobacteriota bacterium]